MSLSLAVTMYRQHLDYSRHLNSLPLPEDPVERQAFLSKKHQKIGESMSRLVNRFPSNILMQAYRKVMETEKNHVYLVTFTFDPSNGIPNLAHAQKYLNSRLTTKELSSREVLTYVYALEHHQDGRPHFHLVIESKKTIPKSYFREWSRKHGNYDFSKSTTGDIRHTLEYVSKETVPKVLRISAKARLYLTQSGPRNNPENPEN